MSNQEGLIYPPGWSREQDKTQDLTKDLARRAGLQFADIAIKWGSIFAQMDNLAIFRTKLWGIEPHITIIANARPDGQGVIVRKKDQEGLGSTKLMSPDNVMIPLPSGQYVERTPSGRDEVVTKDPGMIEWDTELTIEEAVELLVKIDAEAEKRGLYDSTNKQRRPLPEPIYVSLPKFKVEEVFSEIGAVGALLGQKPEELLEQFDHPEDLVVRNDPYTGKPIAVAHKTDVEYLDKRDRIINEVLLEKGLTYKELSDGLANRPDDFVSIWKAVHEEANKRTEGLHKAEVLRRTSPRQDPGAEATRIPLIAFFEGKIDEAKRLFEEAIKNYPDSSYVQHEYAVILAQIDGLEAALPHFIKATEAKPKDLIHFLQAAKCLWQLGRREESLGYIRKLPEFDEIKKIMEEQNLTTEDIIEFLKQQI